MSLIQIREMNMDLSVMSLLLTSIFIMFGKIWRGDVMTPNALLIVLMELRGIEEFKMYSNFRKWYEENGDGSHSLEIDKDCKSLILNIPKIYSSNTCILLPPEINTFISTIGKGIYLTSHNTYCVRLRRRFVKVKDMEYLNILVEKYPLSIDNLDIVKRYVEIFEYSSDICRSA